MRESAAIVFVFSIFLMVLAMAALIFETEASVEKVNAAYIQDVRGYNLAMSDDRLITIGRSICRDLDAYMTDSQVMESISMTFNVAPATAAVLMEPATSNFCPNHG